jgi:hypothetical protein
MGLGRVLNRFIRSFIVFLVCGACFLGQSLFAAENTSLDSLGKSSTNESARDTVAFRELVKSERLEVDTYRSSMVQALSENRIDDLKQIVSEAENFERTAQIYPVFFATEKILLNYFVGNFEYLSNVDSVADCMEYKAAHDRFQDSLYTKLRKQLETGELEKTLKNVEDESDRAFIYITIVGLFENRNTMPDLVEKYKPLLTKVDQLNYVNSQFGSVIDYKSHKNTYFAGSVGAAFVKPVGRVSDRIKSGVGFYVAVDYILDRFIFDWLMDFTGHDVIEPDTLRFSDWRWDFSFGYAFIYKENLRVYGLVGLGVGIDRFWVQGTKTSDEVNRHMPENFMFSFGASGVVDWYLGDSGFGIRFRAGMRNIFAEKVLNSSGAKMHASLELLICEF